MRRSLASIVVGTCCAVSLCGCGSLLGYEDDYVVGAAGASGAGAGGVGGAGGAAGTGALPGGRAGAGSGGAAGSAGSAAGNAGSPAGSAGSPGGNAGAPAGNAGAPAGGGGAPAGSAGAAGVAGGAAGGGGSAGIGSGGAGGALNPTDCSVLYVSPAGDDDGDGCAPSKAKRSPASALGSAVSSTVEIRICDGDYAVMGLTLAKNVSLRGSYDCATWERPLWKADAPRTHLDAAAGDEAALRVTGTSVTRGVVIDGLRLQGPVGKGTSRGIWLTKGASPSVRQCQLLGGKTDSTSLGSVGVVVDQGAAPLLDANVIAGATARTTGNAAASVGLFLASDAGLAEIVKNRISAGEGTVRGTGIGSVGVFVEPLLFAFEGEHALRDNVIESGIGQDELDEATPLSVGIALRGGSTAIAVRGGRIMGGTAEAKGANVAQDRSGDAVAIHSIGHKRLRLDHVRMYGGDATAPRGGSAAISQLAGDTRVVSCLLHAGGARLPTNDTRAIGVTDGASVELLGSTVLTGFQSPTSASPGGSKALYSYGKVKAVFRSNLIVQQSGYAPGIQMDTACGLATGSVLEANAFVYTRGNDPIFQQTRGDCVVNASKVADAEAAIPGSSKNLRISPSTTAAPDIPLACSSADECLAKLLSTYDAATHGLSQVLSDTDDQLSPRLPTLCRLAVEGVAVIEAPTDLLGKARPMARISMGAFQVGEILCPP